MAFGFAAQPTRNYAYKVVGLNAPNVRNSRGQRVPFEGHDLATEQLFLAHRFQCALVEIERKRREEADTLIHERAPALSAALAAADQARSELAAARAEVAAANSEHRRRGANRDLTTRARELAAVSREAWAEHRRLKDATYNDPDIRAALCAIEDAAASATAAARTEAIAGGLYWGTAAHVMTRVKRSGPPPRFPRWDGTGLLALQIQAKPADDAAREPVLLADGRPRLGRGGRPMTRPTATRHFGIQQVLAGESTMVQLRRRENSVNQWLLPGHGGQTHVARSDGSPRNNQWLLSYRVNSTATGEPVLLTIPIHYHRPIPADASIKWVYLTRTKCGTNFTWRVIFVLAKPSWGTAKSTAPPEHTVAVALGWRKIGNTIRLATWEGSDGRTGEVVIPAERLDGWGLCRSLQSIRDTQFTADVAALRAFARGRDLPPEWAAQVAHMHSWRSPRRLAQFVLWWRTHRIPGDDDLYRRLEGEHVPGGPAQRDHCTGGRRQDKHLYDWQEGERAKLGRWRKWYYRQVAVELAGRYGRCIVAEIDWHEIGVAAPVEEADDVNRTYRGIAACASLRDAIAYKMPVVELSAVNVARRCHVCGNLCPDPGRARYIVCEPCGGERHDRAENVAKNLLQQALEQSA